MLNREDIFRPVCIVEHYNGDIILYWLIQRPSRSIHLQSLCLISYVTFLKHLFLKTTLRTDAASHLFGKVLIGELILKYKTLIHNSKLSQAAVSNNKTM